jgi:hypothetical protein
MSIPLMRARPVSGSLKGLSFRELPEKTSTFVTVAELVTSRGLITERSGRRVLSLARLLSEHLRFHVLSTTDNPSGHSMLSADTLGTDLVSRRQEVIIITPARIGTATRWKADPGSLPAGDSKTGRASLQNPRLRLRRLLTPPTWPFSVLNLDAQGTKETGRRGGTRQGLCEVGENESNWSRGYERLQA